MYDDLKASTVSQIRDVLEHASYVRNYHLSVKEAININYGKDRVLIRMWINKDVKDADDVINTLSDKETFEQHIKRLAKRIDLSVSFDVYEI